MVLGTSATTAAMPPAPRAKKALQGMHQAARAQGKLCGYPTSTITDAALPPSWRDACSWSRSWPRPSSRLKGRVRLGVAGGVAGLVARVAGRGRAWQAWW